MTGCGPGADHGRAGTDASDGAQSGELRQNLDAVESAAESADADTAADNG